MEVQRVLLRVWPWSWRILRHLPVMKGTGSAVTPDTRPGDAAELGKGKGNVFLQRVTHSRGLGARRQPAPELQRL